MSQRAASKRWLAEAQLEKPCVCGQGEKGMLLGFIPSVV